MPISCYKCCHLVVLFYLERFISTFFFFWNRIIGRFNEPLNESNIAIFLFLYNINMSKLTVLMVVHSNKFHGYECLNLHFIKFYCPLLRFEIYSYSKTIMTLKPQSQCLDVLFYFLNKKGGWEFLSCVCHVEWCPLQFEMTQRSPFSFFSFSSGLKIGL